MSLLQMSFSGAVMILAITVIRALTINQVPKKTFLILWRVVFVRLLVPFSLPSLFSIYSFLGRKTPIMDHVRDTPAVNFLPIVPSEQITAIPYNTSSVGAAVSVWEIIWVIGVMLCALFFAVVYWKCCREFQMSLPVENDFICRWLKAHQLKRSVSIRQSGFITAPLTFGVFHPVILMPKKTDWGNERTLQYVLEHEFVHIRRFDTLTKLLLMMAVCVHWFNPLVWVMYVLANRDIELSCDEIVVRRFGENTRAAYAKILIGMEETRSGLTPLCNHFSKNAIEERITAIMKMKKTTKLSFVLACFIVLGTAAAFATSAQAGSETRSLEEQDRLFDAESVADDITLMSYVSPDDGRTYYSWDGGQTFEPLTDEEYEQRFPTLNVEWWTYDEYAQWLEHEKAQLQEMIGERGWTGSRGEFVWTQEIVDETIAMYETILQEIGEGKMYSKSVDGGDGDMIVMSYDPADIEIEQSDDIEMEQSEAEMIGRYTVK